MYIDKKIKGSFVVGLYDTMIKNLFNELWDEHLRTATTIGKKKDTEKKL